MAMIWLFKQLNKDYGVEFCSLYSYRNFSDGVSFIDFNINWDRYLADHTPRFDIRLAICNFMLIDFSVYYLHHRDELYGCPEDEDDCQTMKEFLKDCNK